MMASLFLLLTLILIMIFLDKRKAVFFLAAILLALFLGILFHHITDTLKIQL